MTRCGQLSSARAGLALALALALREVIFMAGGLVAGSGRFWCGAGGAARPASAGGAGAAGRLDDHSAEQGGDLVAVSGI
jgi:hypothetical protein